MKQANNLKLGAIYVNGHTGAPCRLVTILPCQGAWLESYDGQGYGETVNFEDIFFASDDEVQDFLEDLAAFKATEKAPSHKEMSEQRVKNYDTYWNVQGYYEDSYGNDIRCRD